MSGLKVAGIGALAGAAALVTAPVVGAQQEGFGGFCSGLAQGMVGAVGLTMGGMAAGVTQMTRGVINTPEAVMQVQQGKIWDPELGKWVDDTINLREEIAKVNQEESDEDSDEGG